MSSISAPNSAPSPRQIKLRCVRTAGVGSAGISAAQFSASSNDVALVASASVPVALVASVASASVPVALVASASSSVASQLRSVASVASRSLVELLKSQPRFSSVALLADLSCVPPVLTPIRVALRQVASPHSTATPVAFHGRKISQSRQFVPQRLSGQHLSSACASSELRSSPSELPPSELPPSELPPSALSASELFELRHRSVASVASASPSSVSPSSVFSSSGPRSVLGKVIERMAAARRDDMSKRMSRRFAAKPDTTAEVAAASRCVVEKSSTRAPSNSPVASSRVSPVFQTAAGRKHLH